MVAFKNLIEGGLGHLGVKYSAAMGYNTVAITTDAKKEQEAKSFGASKIIVSKDAEDMKKNEGTIDLIICTVNSFK